MSYENLDGFKQKIQDEVALIQNSLGLWSAYVRFTGLDPLQIEGVQESSGISFQKVKDRLRELQSHPLIKEIGLFEEPRENHFDFHPDYDKNLPPMEALEIFCQSVPSKVITENTLQFLFTNFVRGIIRSSSIYKTRKKLFRLICNEPQNETETFFCSRVSPENEIRDSWRESRISRRMDMEDFYELVEDIRENDKKKFDSSIQRINFRLMNPEFSLENDISLLFGMEVDKFLKQMEKEIKLFSRILQKRFNRIFDIRGGFVVFDDGTMVTLDSDEGTEVMALQESISEVPERQTFVSANFILMATNSTFDHMRSARNPTMLNPGQKIKVSKYFASQVMPSIEMVLNEYDGTQNCYQLACEILNNTAKTAFQNSRRNVLYLALNPDHIVIPDPSTIRMHNLRINLEEQLESVEKVPGFSFMDLFTNKRLVQDNNYSQMFRGFINPGIIAQSSKRLQRLFASKSINFLIHRIEIKSKFSVSDNCGVRSRIESGGQFREMLNGVLEHVFVDTTSFACTKEQHDKIMTAAKMFPSSFLGISVSLSAEEGITRTLDPTSEYATQVFTEARKNLRLIENEFMTAESFKQGDIQLFIRENNIGMIDEAVAPKQIEIAGVQVDSQIVAILAEFMR